MKTFDLVVGIDVAKNRLAMCIYDGISHSVIEFDYTQKSIRKEMINRFKKDKERVVFVMESTGVYHTKLVYILLMNGFKVSALNPFIIKKYAEMKLMRVKTDSVDAKLIAEYGYDNQRKLEFYKVRSDALIYVDNLLKAIDDFLHIKSMMKNQQHALINQAHYSKDALAAYRRQINTINKEIKRLEKQLLELLQKEFNEEYKLLTSIPGIGLKVSSMIISVFNSFNNFTTAKQACNFVGIAPSPYESGSSVKGRGSISKRGNAFARQILYMGALSAIQYNSLIKKQYTRLLENGKCKMVALVAAANKLLRQAFGVLKSRTPFDSNYAKP